MARAKRKTLPFVVQPRLEPVVEIIGTPESGQIEIKRNGFLTVSEKAFTQAMQTEDSPMMKIQGLVLKISREQGVDKDEVFNQLSAGERPAYFDDYEAELDVIMAQMFSFQEKLKLIQATALLYSRIDSNWGVEDTLELHIDLVDGLAELYIDEENKNLEALEAAFAEKKEKQGKE